MKKSSRSLRCSGDSIEKLAVVPGLDPPKQVGFAGSWKYALSSRKCAWKCLRVYQEFRMSTMMSTDFSKFMYCKMSYDIVYYFISIHYICFFSYCCSWNFFSSCMTTLQCLLHPIRLQLHLASIIWHRKNHVKFFSESTSLFTMTSYFIIFLTS